MTTALAKPDRFYQGLSRSFRNERIKSLVKWAEQFVRLPGSARSERFDSSITPWTHEPIERIIDPLCNHETFVKPVQSGGSVVGEVAICKWIATENGGDVQYNWEDDEKADARYSKRIERILRACRPVMERWPGGSDRSKVQKGLVMFPHLNFTNQGVFTDKRVASDSIRFQCNEEIHAWKAGRLGQAWKRTTAYWNHFILDVSNASVKGDQLHQAFESGTKQYWEILCPGCRKFHRMKTRWDDRRPDLGGLRYDADGCRREDGSYDYNKLAGTIRFQMPCGFLVREEPSERRSLSLSGRYGDPTNTGAQLAHRSYSLEAVSVDYIPFIQLIEEKHVALRALKFGDPEPYKRYIQERECGFWDSKDRPIVGRVTVTKSLRLNRDGLLGNPLFHARFFALDRQQGTASKGELPHWWLLIRDALSTGDSRLVYEGKVETDANVVDILDDHKCVRRMGLADSGDDTTHVYQFCLRYGINAIKGSPSLFFAHEVQVRDRTTGLIVVKTVRRIYSKPEPLFGKIGAAPTRANPLEEPEFWLYSKAGIRDRLAWLRSGKAVKWEVPEDVSEDYHSHLESEELVEEIDKTGHKQMVWSQFKDRNDQFVNECYVALLMDMAGIIGSGPITAALVTAGEAAEQESQ